MTDLSVLRNYPFKTDGRSRWNQNGGGNVSALGLATRAVGALPTRQVLLRSLLELPVSTLQLPIGAISFGATLASVHLAAIRIASAILLRVLGIIAD